MKTNEQIFERGKGNNVFDVVSHSTSNNSLDSEVLHIA